MKGKPTTPDYFSRGKAVNQSVAKANILTIEIDATQIVELGQRTFTVVVPSTGSSMASEKAEDNQQWNWTPWL